MHALVIVGVIAGGLVLDQRVEFWGQTLTNVGVWALFLYWLRRADAANQTALTACLVYATLGEIFLSLVWGLYDYRLGNIPLFVPPGHALLFMLGGLLAARAKEWIVWFVPLAATPFVCFLLLSGTGTFDPLLFALFLLCLLFGRAKKLYAMMFLLSLAMEIYGTWLGNWAWSPAVPRFDFTTTNPPLAAGAFYCVLDLLIVSTVSALGHRRVPPACALGAAIQRSLLSCVFAGESPRLSPLPRRLILVFTTLPLTPPPRVWRVRANRSS